MSETIRKIGICGLCGSTCPIQAQVKDNTMLSVQRLEGHPYLEGKLCVRGAALKQYVHNKERILHPMKRVGPKGSGQYAQISWEEAISEIAGRLRRTKEESGAHATVFFAGHPKRHRKILAELAAAYGSPNFCTESSTCSSAVTIAWKLVCGAQLQPDIAHSKTHVIWTANPGAGNGDIMSVYAAKQGGTKLIVVDPRVTATANLADLHLQPYPGTDGALALSIAHVILREGMEDRDYIVQQTEGFEEYRDYVLQFPPELGERLTGVPADKIVQAAHMLARGKVSLKTSSCAVVHAVNGVQNLRAALLLLALTGSLGVEGGNIAPTPRPRASLDTFHHDLAQRAAGMDISGGAYPVWDELINNEAQCAKLADVLLRDEPYRVRNLIMIGANAAMWPDAERLMAGLKKVEYRVVTELFWNEACEDAELILPACTAPEREHVAIGKNNHLVYIPSMLDPEDKLPDEEIMLRIAHALDLHAPMLDLEDYQAYLNYIIRKNNVTLQELMDHPEGVQARLGERKALAGTGGFRTPSGKVEFVSRVMARHADREGHDPLPVYVDWREKAGLGGDYPFILCTGARKAHFFHSRTYRMDWISDLEPHTLAAICPADAEKIGVKEGEFVRLSTPMGWKEYQVALDFGIKPGVVHVYHDDPAQNVNELLDGEYLDPVSGFPGYRSYVCRLEKCEEGEQA